MVERKKPVSEISRIISKNMQRIVKETGNTIDSGAKLMGIPVRSRFGHYLNQYVEIPVEVIFKFRQVFNVSLDELFGLKDVQPHTSDSTYPIIEGLEATLQKTHQRLTPKGFTKIVDILRYEANLNNEEAIIDILKKARLLSPEIFVS
jgi:hypothetical protein